MFYTGEYKYIWDHYLHGIGMGMRIEWDGIEKGVNPHSIIL